MNAKDFETRFHDKESKVYKVFQALKDKQWHRRERAYQHMGITQIAGGSGIQGLERASQNVSGMIRLASAGGKFCNSSCKREDFSLIASSFVCARTLRLPATGAS